MILFLSPNDGKNTNNLNNKILQNLKETVHLQDLGIYKKDSMTRDLKKMGWDGMDWIHMAQDRCKLIW
jgi:hypothetical protein